MQDNTGGRHNQNNVPNDRPEEEKVIPYSDPETTVDPNENVHTYEELVGNNTDPSKQGQTNAVDPGFVAVKGSKENKNSENHPKDEKMPVLHGQQPDPEKDKQTPEGDLYPDKAR